MFAEGNPVPPGTYRVDVYLNDAWKGKRSVRFETRNPGDRIAQPCFDAEFLDVLGFDPKRIAPDVQARLQAGESICASLDQVIPDAQSSFDSGLQRLNMSAPQIALVRRARGYVDPSRWDAGITAATLAYNYNAWHNKQPLLSQTSHYLSLRGGINVGDWRFRYRGTVTRNTTTGLRYRNSAFYVEHALPSLRSALLLGESSTRTQVFDSLSFRGVRLGSEDRMRPESHNGFAPVINGIAQSNAKVSITQRGVQIFETTVPPGPFVIDDLYPNGSGGDLRVTITEADGSEHSFTVAYANLPELLRPGMTRYSLAAGRYRNPSLLQEPFFGVASVSHGFNNTVTGYGGLLAGQGYRAASAGVGLNLPIGAVMLDGTYAHTVGVSTGYGFRLAYIKQLPATQTDISLAVLRTATRGYYEPAQAFRLRDALKRDPSLDLPPQRRNQLSISMHQPLPRQWGSLSLSGSVQNYWRRPGYDVQYSLGYGRTIGGVSASLNAMRSRNVATGRWDNQYLLSFAIPLGGSTGSPVHMSTTFAHGAGSQTLQNSVSGTSNGRQPFHYSAYSALNKNRGQAVRGGGGFNLSTTTPVARLGGSVAVATGNAQQFGMHASGGVVAFKGGVVFSPELGETVGIVQAKNAQGVRVTNAPGVRLNSRGQAVVPYLQAYRENEVNLDPKGVSTDVELATTSQRVAPTHGAVVLLEYETRHGYAILAKLQRADGSDVPFAAGVFDAQGKNLGYLAQGGQALIRVDEPQGELTVRWGSRAEQQCRFRYDMSAVQNAEKHVDPRANAAGVAEQFRRVEMVCLS